MIVQQRTWQERYLDRFYRTRPDWVDGTTQFHQLIKKHLDQDKHVLELGPGLKNSTSDFLCKNFASVDGLDVDDDAKKNPDLRRVYLVQDGDTWPVPDESYDAVVARYVLEHLSEPAHTAAQAHRVLRPGGMFFFQTPNLCHYVSLVSSMSPHWFHRLVANRLRNLPPETHAPYQTFYRMNRRRTIKRIMQAAGFNEMEMYTIEKEPSYGLSSRLLFFLFMSYERIVNSSDGFSMFRSNISGVFVKSRPAT